MSRNIPSREWRIKAKWNWLYHTYFVTQPRMSNLVSRALFPPQKRTVRRPGDEVGFVLRCVDSVFLPGTLPGHFLIMNCVLNLYEGREASFTLVRLTFVICAIRLPEAALPNLGYSVGSTDKSSKIHDIYCWSILWPANSLSGLLLI